MSDKLYAKSIHRWRWLPDIIVWQSVRNPMMFVVKGTDRAGQACVCLLNADPDGMFLSSNALAELSVIAYHFERTQEFGPDKEGE